MISWIQKYFQRHFKLVFVLMLAAMAVPLIVIFTPSSGIGQGGRNGISRDFFGYNLGSQEDTGRLFGDAQLSATLKLGYAGIGGEQLQQYALQRVAALHLADEMHVPASTPAEISDYIKSLRIFSGPDGGFDAQRYASFRDSLKGGGARVTEADVSRILADDVRADKVRQLLAGPGYVLDADVKDQLARAQTTWTLGVATVNYGSFNPAIKPTNEELTKYFADNSFRYQIPPRMEATCVLFPLTDYLDKVTTTEDELKAYFDSAPSRFQKPAGDAKDPKATKPAQAGDFALVHDQVESAVQIVKARQLAVKAASDLSLELYKSGIANQPDALASFLAAHHVKQSGLTPFTEQEGPTEFDNAADLGDAAFKLTGDRFYTDALPVKVGAVVILRKDIIPARTPLMSEVLVKVTADYVDNEKRKRFVELGQTLKGLIENRLKSGDSFSQAVDSVAGATSAKIDVKMMDPFSAANPPKDADYAIFGPLEHLQQGQISDMIMSKEQGLFVYAAGKKLPNLTETNPDYQQTRRQIAAATARVGASEYLDEVVATELKRTEPKVN